MTMNGNKLKTNVSGESGLVKSVVGEEELMSGIRKDEE